MDWISETLQSIDNLCRKYDNVISRINSSDEEDEEERWQVKETTKTIMTELDQRVVPMTKQAVWRVRALNSRMKNLIDKCDRVFPQMDELGEFKSLQKEMDTLLIKYQSSTQCPLCRRFGSYKLIADAAGEDDNVFIYVAEKIASSGRAAAKGKEAVVTVPPSQTDDSEYTIRPKKTVELTKTTSSKSNGDLKRTVQPTEDADTETIHSPTVHTDPMYKEDEEIKTDLIWKDYEDTEDAKTPPPRRRSRREYVMRRRKGKRKAALRLPAPNKQKSIEWRSRIKSPLAENIDVIESMDKDNNGSPPDIAQVASVDWISHGSISAVKEISSAEESSGQVCVENGTPPAKGRHWLMILAGVILMNLVVYFLRFLFALLTTPNIQLGLTIWPAYCKAANALCKDGYEFACTDYCASRLERYLWGRK